ncbi:MAG TPA: hypothetical protein VIM99_08270, partial [Blastocatellia bacterium]
MYRRVRQSCYAFGMATSKNSSSLFPELEEGDGKRSSISGKAFDAGSSTAALATAPLAERMRPRTLDEFVGQEHLLAEGKILRRLIEEDRLTSLVFWG